MKAIVLLSGGLDSATALAVAKSEGRDCLALGVLYGQRHRCEISAAHNVAAAVGVPLHVIEAMTFGSIARSALTADVAVPKDRSHSEMSGGVPATYVPARNTVLLGFALACAETIGAREIWTGFNVLDASGYPDCRPAFVSAFEALANVATAPGEPWSIRAPLIALTKAEIIKLGTGLGLDYAITHSCYDPVGDLACGRCDSCQLRRRGFVEVGIADPTRYA